MIDGGGRSQRLGVLADGEPRVAMRAVAASAAPKRLVWSQATIVACLAAAIFLALSLFLNGFLSPSNLINLVRNVTVLGIFSIGMAAVVIGRGVDLSMVPIMAGWLRTGDRGRIDADGYLWITGLKDVIIRGGHNIDPALGELPVLYVQLKPETRATEEELGYFLHPRILERAAIPKSISIVPEIPLSGPGKISKLLLRRQAIADGFQDELDR